ncbi:class I SAM-dependent methyltransferase [Mycolicibacillus parakoreensis]|uniref:Class I SAM-dependent methyltransferase n=1 Tax=Mycolicibacillus parakoreensis TaxID=1069221 RepID=A0ABY3U470_9MYCO|nr:class I SAM-dependent methyltransferase [Mycolicibacillus parakoreensis]MCV7314198.1 class I SAM-dependent methyltransferase [Mycolicibacillus parakoreensis]ULN54775.1 class I SAM-dependent methyltransferase [Mycolicibacillus parakoreensis]HLR98762.1 class I SAM-dependent methyltransferase [Mycolicibacillus parakoreensis]
MDHMAARPRDIATMPRGGYGASCLDRWLQTDRTEYLDRPDGAGADDKKRQVVRSLELLGTLLGDHDRFARLALAEVAEVPDPRIVELGAGHGALSRRLLAEHPTAEVTVTDVQRASVAAMAAGELGRHPRATVRALDATAIDADDCGYDLAVFALSFHHLAPPEAARVLAEGTRVADRLLLIEPPRPPSLLQLLRVATLLPWAPLVPYLHDALISSLRLYSPAALRDLAAHADAGIELTVRDVGRGMHTVLATRRG